MIGLTFRWSNLIEVTLYLITIFQNNSPAVSNALLGRVTQIKVIDKSQVFRNAKLSSISTNGYPDFFSFLLCVHNQITFRFRKSCQSSLKGQRLLGFT